MSLWSNITATTSGWFKAATDTYKKLTNRHFPEAVMSACALIATADGSISSQEKTRAMAAVRANELLRLFKIEDLQQHFNTHADACVADAEFGAAGALSVIQKCRGDETATLWIIRAAIAVGSADGNFDDKEKARTVEICRVLGEDPAKYDLTPVAA
jgi:tellurite resistance protein TerB